MPARPAVSAAAARAVVHATTRRAGPRQRREARVECSVAYSALFLCTIAAIHVRDDAVVGPEAHAISADVADGWDGDGERGLAAGPERRRLDDGASAREKAAVAIEHEHH